MPRRVKYSIPDTAFQQTCPTCGLLDVADWRFTPDGVRCLKCNEVFVPEKKGNWSQLGN